MFPYLIFTNLQANTNDVIINVEQIKPYIVNQKLPICKDKL